MYDNDLGRVLMGVVGMLIENRVRIEQQGYTRPLTDKEKHVIRGEAWGEFYRDVHELGAKDE